MKGKIYNLKIYYYLDNETLGEKSSACWDVQFIDECSYL